MNRMWLGAALLVLLLIIGIGAGTVMNNLHTPIADALTQAADAAMEEDWQKNAALILQARADWEQCRDLTAIVSDQRPMDEIDELFAQLEYLCTLRDTNQCTTLCAQLAQLVRSVGQSHAVNLPNLL